MSMPRYIPKIAHTGGNYPAGGESYSGTERRVELPAGEQATGFVPGDPFDAQIANWLHHTFGEAVEAIIDAPSFNWTPMQAFEDSLLINVTLNLNDITDPALLYASSEKLLLKTEVGNSPFFHHRFGQGYQSYSDDDNTLWNGSSAADTDIPRPLIIARRDSSRVVLIAKTGSSPGAGGVYYTDDYGATYTAGGTAQNCSCGLWYAGAWHAVATSATDTHVVRSSSTLSGSWGTSGSITAVADEYTRAIHGAPAGIFLPASSDNTGTQSDALVNTGSGWNAVTLTTDDNQTGWRGDYNPNTGVYLIGNKQGKIYTSTNATSWTLVKTWESAIYDVAAHGRGFLLSSGTEDFAGDAQPAYLDYCYMDHEQNIQCRRVGFESPAAGSLQFYSRFYLMRHRGRVYAARVVNPSGDIDRIEWWVSDVHPSQVSVTAGV